MGQLHSRCGPVFEGRIDRRNDPRLPGFQPKAEEIVDAPQRAGNHTEAVKSRRRHDEGAWGLPYPRLRRRLSWCLAKSMYQELTVIAWGMAKARLFHANDATRIKCIEYLQ